MKPTLILVLLFILKSGFAQDTLYVDLNASGLNNGSDWLNAYTHVQLALDTAQPGDEIWVAKGTYKPYLDKFGDSTIHSALYTFVLKDSVTVFGGFQSGDSSRLNRNWLANQTVLSGDVGVVNSSGDNSIHVITNDDNDLNWKARLDGFTVCCGFDYYSGGSTGSISGGAGIYNYKSSPALVNLVLKEHSTTSRGAAIFNRSSSPFIANCIIHDNYADFVGAGIYNNNSNAIMINLLVYDNHNFLNPGAIYNHQHNTSKEFYAKSYHISSFDNERNGNITGDYRDIGYNSEISNSFINDLYPVTWLDNFKFSHCMLPGSGGSGSWQWNGNYAIDLGGNQDTTPVFLDSANFDFRYHFTSRGINQGFNDSIPKDLIDYDEDGDTNEYFPVDLLGNPRIVGGIVDIGPFEHPIGYIDTADAFLCNGRPYNFNGRLLDTFGTYTTRFINNTNDSLVTLTLIGTDSVNSNVIKSNHGGTFTAEEDSATYRWYDCFNSMVLPDTGRSFTPVKNGSYALIITNENGCIDTSDCIVIYTVGFEEFEQEISIYPNPAKGFVKINIPVNMGNGIVQLIDGAGRLLEEDEFQTGELVTIPLDKLKSGLYLVKIQGDKGSKAFPLYHE